jgi:hypothetical protein
MNHHHQPAYNQLYFMAVVKCFVLMAMNNKWIHSFGSHLCVSTREMTLAGWSSKQTASTEKGFCAIISLLVVLSRYAFYSLFVVPLSLQTS